MDDLISRAAALDALGKRPVVWTDKIYYILGARNQYDKDRLAIETVPSAQRWIPCSTEMPPTGKDVLVTLVSGIVTDGERWEPQEGKWFLFGGGVNGLDEDVLAWMPLPEPARLGD